MKQAVAISVLMLLLLANTVRAAELESEQLFEKDCWRIAVSPDGKRLAAADKRSSVAIYEFGGEARHLNCHTEEVWALDFTGDGRQLVSAGIDGKVCISSVRTGKLERTIETKGRVSDFALSPDGRRLAIVWCEDDACEIRSFADGKVLKRLALPTASNIEGTQTFSRVCFSADGSFLVASCGGRAWPKYVGGPSTISVWRTEDWTLNRRFEADPYVVFDLEISPDDRLLAAATNRGKTVKVWELPPVPQAKAVSEQRVAELVEQLGSRLFADRDAAQRELRSVGHAAMDQLKKAAESDVFERRRRATRLLDDLLGVKTVPRNVHKANTWDVHSVAFSPKGGLLASSRQSGRPGNVVLWTMSESPTKLVAPLPNGAWDVTFTPDGQKLVAAVRDGTIVTWHVSLLGNGPR